MENVEKLKQDLIAVCRVIAHQGLADAFAHVSARLPGTESMLFMPGKSPALVKLEELFVVDLHTPVSQSAVHQAIYRARPDVMAIVHTHPPRAIALTLVGETIRPVHNDSVMFWQGVPVYDIPGRVNDSETGDKIARVLGQCAAILLRGHGVLTAAGNLRDACLLSIFLERTAVMLLEVAPLGRAKEFPKDQAKEFAPQFFNDSSNQRAWEHFKQQAGVA